MLWTSRASYSYSSVTGPSSCFPKVPNLALRPYGRGYITDPANEFTRADNGEDGQLAIESPEKNRSQDWFRPLVLDLSSPTPTIIGLSREA